MVQMQAVFLARYGNGWGIQGTATALVAHLQPDIAPQQRHWVSDAGAVVLEDGAFPPSGIRGACLCEALCTAPQAAACRVLVATPDEADSP